MKESLRIALVGDYNPDVPAHQAIPVALGMVAEQTGYDIAPEWVFTSELDGAVAGRLSGYDAVWVVPASPYRSMNGALAAIEYARTTKMPFLGTCGGFQHTLIEYARNVLGMGEAAHAETDPDASVLFVAPLACALRGVDGPINFESQSRMAEIYGTTRSVEQYYCGFGLHPEYRDLFEQGAMSITGVDDEGDARVVELADHPFFIATLYQPERAALRGINHPLIGAYVQAAAEAR